MFFFTFLSLLSAAEESLQFLSDKTFEAKVINHPPNEVWIVLFMTDETNETRAALAQFRNASETSGGMVHYGVLNVRFAPSVAEALKLTSYPSVRIFHGESKMVPIKGVVKPGKLLKETNKFLQDFSQTVTESWKEEFFAQPSAVLFTNSPNATLLWKGISSFFARKPIRVGICRDAELIKSFNIQNVPSIMFYNGTHTQLYEGKLAFKPIRDAIETFFYKRFHEETVVGDDEMLMPDQFNEICIGGKQLCVLAAMKSPPEGMSVLMKEGARRKVRCFSGVVGLPFKFMERGGVWIYNPRRDGFIHIKDGKDLLQTMDRVIDGTAQWTKRSVFESEKGAEL